jgi:hypothetical protein
MGGRGDGVSPRLSAAAAAAMLLSHGWTLRPYQSQLHFLVEKFVTIKFSLFWG